MHCNTYITDCCLYASVCMCMCMCEYACACASMCMRIKHAYTCAAALCTMHSRLTALPSGQSAALCAITCRVDWFWSHSGQVSSSTVQSSLSHTFQNIETSRDDETHTKKIIGILFSQEMPFRPIVKKWPTAALFCHDYSQEFSFSFTPRRSESGKIA